MIISPQELIVYSFTPFKNDSSTPRLKAKGRSLITRCLCGMVLTTLSLFAYTIADGAPRSSSNSGRYVAVADSLVTINLRDYGAVGDGVTDDGPALQTALDALADAGGGTLFVADGTYVIATPVTIDFSSRATAITIEGTPSSSPDDGTGDNGRTLNLTAEFLIKTGPATDAITLQNLTTLSVENIVFIGDPLALNDAGVVLHLSDIDSATVHYCEFYGLSSLIAGGAIVAMEGGNLQITDSAFLGCAGNSGTNTPIVQIYNWTGITITGTRFVDYGDRPDFYSKTPIQSPSAWVTVYGAAPLTNLSPRRDITIKDVLFDEGAYDALAVRPDVYPVPNGGPISLLYLSGLYVNVTNLGDVGLRIHSVENVFIENSHFGWSHNAVGAMELAFVNNALLNQIECVLSADTIVVDPTVAEVSVINSVYRTLNSQAPITRVITTANLADGPAQYVNQKYLNMLGHAPDLPGYLYWSQQRARCNDDAQCTTDEKLFDYLNGNPVPTFSISGQLLDSDGLPIASAAVSMSGTHQVGTITDAQGKYIFSGLATSGEYTVTPSQPFYTFNVAGGPPGNPSRTYITPGGNQTADFTGTLPHYSIGGRVTDPNTQGMAGVRVTLTGGPAGSQPPSQVTGTAGDYSFTNLPAGYTYSLTPTKDSYVFGPSVQTVLLASNTNLNFTGGLATPHSITGRVTDGTHPLFDATVTLSGAANQSTSTDSNGDYRFDGLPAGSGYDLTVSKPHYTFASQTINYLLSDLNIGFAGQIIRHTISGSVTEGPNGLGGVNVTLTGDQTASVLTTDSGNYSFTVDEGGSYTVTATKALYTFEPPSVAFGDLNEDVTAGFSATRLPITLQTVGDTNRAIAFNSISMLSEPFDLSTTPFDFSPDRRTRIILFAINVPASPTSITAEAQDGMGNIYPLTVEFNQSLAEASAITQINVKLNAQIPPGGDVKLTITVDGLRSNTVVIGISQGD